MIPDTFTGGIILSLINLTIVFGVLLIIAFMISLIYKTVSNAENKRPTEATTNEIAISPSESTKNKLDMIDEKGIPFDSLDSRCKAIIIAAVSAYIDETHEIPVFIRRIPDAGAWGKFYRIRASR